MVIITNNAREYLKKGAPVGGWSPGRGKGNVIAIFLSRRTVLCSPNPLYVNYIRNFEIY